ncbi:L,D-transpeptidase family protein [Paenibacillus sp. KQZ6P-2]|uniref:L,D-transpeptidase family protein n=1 Tax=Paenibacillus mangrovi TaxID=2931978 RepID=A0A9X2B3W2_9BACL|nr:L,D-transpeptidase family protein [Paenibacillus mangrovi]MCJ8013846.1 L,D-transpeptidase family protein [Paenibacillus mangrovi]
MMTSQIFHCFLKSVTISILVIFFAGLTVPVHADPSLPIVTYESVYSIDVFPAEHKLIVWKQGKKIKTYRVAVGNPSTPTPVGEYIITYKGKNWGPSFGPRWLGLNVSWGNYGIHGTNRPYSIGQHQSHGCIRMFNMDVLELYEMIPLGTKVTIYGHILGDTNHHPRRLAEGDVGADVQLIQSRLKSAGYFPGTTDGKFGSATTLALKKFQRDHQLQQDGVVSEEVYETLGLVE